MSGCFESGQGFLAQYKNLLFFIQTAETALQAQKSRLVSSLVIAFVQGWNYITAIHKSRRGVKRDENHY
jgi:hypothetical protein